ncbi:hypothetical protein [Ciceribacter sp. L1K22]|uniref:hypothetical protein n=1 Tax=Ciceribacter sp. L1K22 TaxID=2820275 RepID=UPI001ABE17C3|nr:hypothetical protein [Ciceribacter sp. L1K22]MBO3760368.1 hypothetical protein [Ciceribacter sp. L1K22]
MTTIAYRDGVMASDTGVWISGAAMPWAEKLIRGGSGTLYGCAGNGAHVAAVLQWVRESDGFGLSSLPRGTPTGNDGESSSVVILIVPPDGPLRLATAYGDEIYPDVPYFAIGAGAATALGALHAGATARGAIEAALMHSDGTHGEVRSISHTEGQ